MPLMRFIRICRESAESLKGAGTMNPSPEELTRCLNNALFMGLLQRTLDDNTKTHLTSKLNLGHMEIPEFTLVQQTLEKRLNATQSGEKKSTVSA